MARLFDTGIFSVNATNGSIGVGYKLYFYTTGTSTPKATYPTRADAAAGTNANSNPVVAAADGRFAPMWLTDGDYKVILKDADDVTLETKDPGDSNELATWRDAGAAGLDQVINDFQVSGSFSLKSLGGSVPIGSYFGVGGNSLSFQTLISNPSGGADTDNQRATALFSSTTTDDGNSEEQTVCILTKAETGYRTVWATSTAYSIGDNVEANSTIYRCVTAGTSAGAGTGPSGTGTAISDGTCVWTWINDDVVDAKLGLYNEVQAVDGAGSVWAQANNLQMDSGYAGTFAVTYEGDLTNNCGTDSTPTTLYKYNLWLATNGTSKSTATIECTSSNSGSFAAIWGLHFSGAKLAEDSVIGIEASANVGIDFGAAGSGTVDPTYLVATIRDTSTAPKGISLAGTYSSAALEATSDHPISVNISGTKTIAGIYDNSTAPRGLILSGTYSKSPMAFETLPPNYADDAAAAAGGLSVGDVYRNGSILMVRAA